MEELYKLYYNELVAYGMRFIANRHAVEDLVMETMWRVHARNYAGKIRPILLYSVRNACLNYIVATKNRKRTEEGYSYLDAIPGNEIDSGVIILLYQAIEQLPPAAKAVMLLRIKVGLPYKEIATRLNKNRITVRSLKLYAVGLISKKLKKTNETLVAVNESGI